MTRAPAAPVVGASPEGSSPFFGASPEGSSRRFELALAAPGTNALELTLRLPADAGPGEARTVDLSAVPGARLLHEAAWRVGDHGELAITCVRAPVPMWLPGLETSVMAGAVVLTERTLEAGRVEPSVLEPRGHGWQQRFSLSEGNAIKGHGVVLVGFGGVDDELRACSVVCLADGGCRPDLELHGEWAHPPDSAVAAALVAAAAMPGPSACALSAVGALVVSAVLWRRPRPRSGH